jgi:aspartate kinase
VPAARRIPALSYEEALELAESGARVLNAQAIEFAKEKNIAIYARAASSPLPGADPSAEGTIVRRFSPATPGTAVGVASEREIFVVDSTAPLPDVLALFDANGVAGTQLHYSAFNAERMTLVVSRENLHDEARFRTSLAQLAGRVRLVDDLGALSVVGAGINASFENVRRGSGALSAHGIGIDGLATSSFRITWMIDRARLDDAVRLMHASFLEQRRDSGSEPIPNP